MRKILVLALFCLGACSGSSKSTIQALTCETGDTPVYTNRFVPVPGGSGVASAADAAAGKINSEGGGGATFGGAEGPAPAVPATGGPSTPAPKVEGPITAMTAECVASICDPGKVAVELPKKIDPGLGAPATAAVDGTAGPLATSTSPAADTPEYTCVEPPPTCTAGESPQYNISKGFWECTDCALVVTYGGQYGNYRRCVNEPHLDCGDGQVPTWIYETEQWECKTTCDNGAYDQHTITGQLVCVPC
jgi:hypothetical protein